MTEQYTEIIAMSFAFLVFIVLPWGVGLFLDWRRSNRVKGLEYIYRNKQRN